MHAHFIPFGGQIPHLECGGSVQELADFSRRKRIYRVTRPLKNPLLQRRVDLDLARLDLSPLRMRSKDAAYIVAVEQLALRDRAIRELFGETLRLGFCLQTSHFGVEGLGFWGLGLALGH